MDMVIFVRGRIVCRVVGKVKDRGGKRGGYRI